MHRPVDRGDGVGWLSTQGHEDDTIPLPRHCNDRYLMLSTLEAPRHQPLLLEQAHEALPSINSMGGTPSRSAVLNPLPIKRPASTISYTAIGIASIMVMLE